jgi:hypothetical protein
VLLVTSLIPPGYGAEAGGYRHHNDRISKRPKLGVKARSHSGPYYSPYFITSRTRTHYPQLRRCVSFVCTGSTERNRALERVL